MEEHSLTAVVIVGHVDHGKSTFIGRLLLDTNNLSPDRLADIKKASEEQGRKIEYAYATDQFQEERDANITIDTSQTFLKLDNKPYVIIDAPGHKEYLKNMITGATQAESAIIMVDVNEGVREQTDKHAQVLKLLGIRRVAVMINKMDIVNYEESVFRKHEQEVEVLLKERGMHAQVIIPMSAYNGENVVTRSVKMPWYQGPTAMDFLKSCSEILPKAQDKDLRFAVQLIHRLNGERLVLGRVEQGVIEAGKTAMVFPSKKMVVVKKVLRYNETLSHAGVGESVALVVEGEDALGRGHVLCAGPESVKQVRKFAAHTFWASDMTVHRGDEIQVECRTQTGRARVEKIFDEVSGEPMDKLINGDVARVQLQLEGDMLVENTGVNGAFSRLVFQKDGQVAGCGVVAEVMYGQ